jgi:alkane 1-monooxygenase
LAATFPAGFVASTALGGAWLGITLVHAFVILPLLDALCGPRRAAGSPSPADRRRFALMPWLGALAYLGVFAWGVYWASEPERSLLERLLGSVSLGVIGGGMGVTVAHELLHQRRAAPRFLAGLVLTSVSYPHFAVAHVSLHHRYVGTPLDPATARRGESLYAFLPRSILRGLAGAYRLETRHARRRKLGPLRDRRYRHALALACLYGAAWLTAGWTAIAVVATHSAAAVLLLESINYVQHYGLERARLSDGRYVEVGPEHAWDGAHRVTNQYLFDLEHHADHHRHPTRPYFELRSVAGAPELPASYPALLLLAAVPPWWRRVMDRRLPTWRRPAILSDPAQGSTEPS